VRVADRTVHAEGSGDIRYLAWLCRGLVTLLALVSPLPAVLLLVLWALIPGFVAVMARRDVWPDGTAVRWGEASEALRRASRAER